MKSTICITVILLFAFSLTPPMVTGGDATPEPVLDIAGKNLTIGINYLILPLLKCRDGSTKCIDGGGISLSTTKNRTCPPFVMDTSHAMPLKFTPFDPKQGSVIRVSTDMNIRFSVATTCVQSTVWKLQQFDGSSGQWFVTTGGVEGNPGRETVSNWFEIERYGNGSDYYYYKLVFCPKVCKFCKVLCKDLGIFVDGDGNRRLALSDVPFGVRFQKA